MLAILRQDDESLAHLVAEGERPLTVPSGVDLCGYRTVQEALTNVVKHARAGGAVRRVVRGRPANQRRLRRAGPPAVRGKTESDDRVITVAVVGEGSNGEEGVTLAQQLRPDVVLMDGRPRGHPPNRGFAVSGTP